MAINQELLSAGKNASEKYGIPSTVIYGIAGFETSYGTAGVGKSRNNLFGIMQSDGKTAITFDSVTDSVEYFAKLVTGNFDGPQSKKYGEATATATTVEDWINAIVNAGYNSEYAEGVYTSKVMEIIERDKDSYNLSDDEIISSSSGSGSSGLISKIDLKWWGDVVIVVICILFIVGGVVFLGMCVTNTSDPIKMITEGV